MRRNRKNGIKRERTIMIASSAFVLAALTLTGIYMSGQNADSQNDGYTLDFTQMEESADVPPESPAEETQPLPQQAAIEPAVPEGELDYMPVEVGSGLVEIPGLTDSSNLEGEAALAGEIPAAEEVLLTEATDPTAADQEAAGQAVTPERTLAFSTETGILRPVAGEILMHYSMGKSIYFATLDQYKYNPAVILSAEQGTAATACSQGKVISIYDNSVTGKSLVLELGDGYQATYGQLADIKVSEGSYVDEGDILGMVAVPSKYYSQEGSNLYFALTKDGTPVNPEVLFR